MERLTDAQWALIEPHLPKRKASPKGGRPHADDRACFEGILWILRTGARWKDLPKEYPSPATCWRRLAGGSARTSGSICGARSSRSSTNELSSTDVLRRASGRNPRIPVLIATADGDALLRDASRLGARAIIRKPFDLDEAVAIARDALATPFRPAAQLRRGRTGSPVGM